ncbi:MAG: CSLREA domain-containing protein [Acidobacteriota bacterium]
MNRPTTLFAGLLFSFLAAIGAAHANTITVNSTADNNVTNDGQCTLREAVQAARDDNMNQSNKDCAWGQGKDKIVFAARDPAAGPVIILNTQIQLSSDLIIQGPATIRSAGSERLFRIGGQYEIDLIELELEDGNEIGAGGAILISTGAATVLIESCVFRNNFAANNGGAINNFNSLVTIKNSEFITNESGANGGAIRGSDLIIENTYFTSNHAAFGGGAIYCSGGGASQPVQVRRTFFENNIAWAEIDGGNQSGGGGAIMSYCHLDVEETEFLANMAFGVVGGGAVLNGSSGVATIRRSLLQVNSAGFGETGSGSGGAILSQGRLVLDRSVLTENVVRGGLGGGGVMFQDSQLSEIVNSVIMNNTAQFDQTHALSTQPNQPQSGGGITIFGNSDVTVIHSSILFNFGKSEIHFVPSPTGEGNFQNTLIQGAFTDETCDGHDFQLFNGGNTSVSGGNLQYGTKTMPTCPEIPIVKPGLTFASGGFGVSTPGGLMSFDYPTPDYFGPAVGGGVATFCSDPVVNQRDLFSFARVLPCDVGAVEVPTQ